MASTGKTTNYELSQFIGTDKPSWLGDYNGDMLKIDTALGSINATATTAQSGVASAQSAASAAQATANAALQKATANAQDITEIKGDLTNISGAMTPLNNVSSGQLLISYNGLTQVIKGSIGWSSNPSSTYVVDSSTLFPIASYAGNVFKIAASAITDKENKIYFGPYSFNYATSSGTRASFLGCYIYYDGANTILYGDIPTSDFSAITQFQTMNGCCVSIFAQNFFTL